MVAVLNKLFVSQTVNVFCVVMSQSGQNHLLHAFWICSVNNRVQAQMRVDKWYISIEFQYRILKQLFGLCVSCVWLVCCTCFWLWTVNQFAGNRNRRMKDCIFVCMTMRKVIPCFSLIVASPPVSVDRFDIYFLISIQTRCRSDGIRMNKNHKNAKKKQVRTDSEPFTDSFRCTTCPKMHV